MKQEILRMERVTYAENEVLLLENLNLQVYSGEIMGLLPINAHGLTDFLRLLQTNLPIYDGYIYYGGEKINSWKESKKTPNRISIIEEKSRLVEKMTVLDNIFVLRQGFRQEIIRTNMLRRQMTPFLEDIGIEISLDAYVENLPVFERVIVELLRAVVLGHRLIVLNEIGTLISYEELGKLHQILRHYAGQGFSFLYICLHYEEIAMACDRVAMFSNGRIQKIIHPNEIEETYLYTEEYDSMVRGHMEKRRKNMAGDREIFRVENLVSEHVSGLSFGVREGECLVMQIIGNNMFRELEQIFMGNLQPDGGACFIEGKEAGFRQNPAVAVIRELPTKTMVFPQLDYMENLCMSLLYRIPSVVGAGRIRSSIRREYGPVLGEEVFSTPVEDLSEKQKYQMIYTRVLLQKPKIVFCVQPFKGADLSHRMLIWRLLETLLGKGIAVVILALNLSDSLSLADRLLQVDTQGKTQEVMQEDFASISMGAPWIHIYRK